MFEVGQIYNRKKDIHDQYGGQEQGGISTPTNHPYIFLFTGSAGENYGYEDKPQLDGGFWYTGEGQIGDMEMVRGNSAILRHKENHKQLLLFQYTKKGFVEFKGEVSCEDHHYETRPDSLGNDRKAIIFHLMPLANLSSLQSKSSGLDIEKSDEEKIIGNKPPRVWIKAFWGFNPDEAGYLGFTKPGDLESFIYEAQDGDLVLIYGSTSEETDADKRRQALGFLEVKLTPIKDVDKMSPEAIAYKTERGWGDRWTNAVPVIRAWEITRKIEIKNIAPETYVHEQARRIASRGALLTETEAMHALRLPTRPINVFGEPQVAFGNTEETQILEFFKPSRGFTPSFGQRISDYQDGEQCLYMLIAKGDVAALLGRPEVNAEKKCMIKIGYSNDPSRRCEEHNKGIPPAAAFRWHVHVASRPFRDGASALKAEDLLKKTLEDCAESLGGEFFLGDQSTMEGAFYKTPGAGFLITGALRR